VRDALVLAAGNGDRFKNGSRESKLLQPVLGRPLILRTLESAYRAGITTAHVVLGYRPERVRALIEDEALPLAVRFHYNPDWHLENGLSVLAARDALADRRFAVLMGDHLFEPATLRRLRHAPVRPGDSSLAVDARPAAPAVVAEATKVQLEGPYVRAIGKHLSRHDALDTGVFVCDPSVFVALDHAIRSGDTTFSGGIRRLAARRVMQALAVVDTPWFDIDTIEDLESAESMLATGDRVEVA
jgi:choline kinase